MLPIVSPDGRFIAFDHRKDPDAASSGTADISILDVSDGSVRSVVAQEGPDTNPRWSPDGKQIAFQSAMRNPWFYYSNHRIAVVSADGGAIRPVSDRFDEQPGLVEWAPGGIYFQGLDKTTTRLYRLDPATGQFAAVTTRTGDSPSGFSFSRDFSTVAFINGDRTQYPEVFVAPVATMVARPLTTFGHQIEEWTIGTREMISWTSTDGMAIEGVLHKPADFQQGRRYPLLVIVHGGPTGISRPARIAAGGVYPIKLRAGAEGGAWPEVATTQMPRTITVEATLWKQRRCMATSASRTGDDVDSVRSAVLHARWRIITRKRRRGERTANSVQRNYCVDSLHNM